MVSLILGAGIPAQLVGGWLGDFTVSMFATRWGRILPVSVSSMIAGVAYFACIGLDPVWLIVVACAVVSFMTDVGNPSIWALMQDIGGRNTSGIYAWANMWGNFGAALTSFLLPLLAAFGIQWGFGSAFMFVFLGSAFLLSGLIVLGMDATQSVQQPKHV